MVTKDHDTGGEVAEDTYTSRRRYLQAATVAGATGLAGCLSLGGGSGTVTVGMAFPYTGPYGASAEKQRDGVELAVKEINEAGGLDGREVETVDRDTELNPDVNARRIRNLLYEEEVDLLVANLSGGITTQTQSLAAEAGVPYMAGSRTSPPFHYPSELGEGSYAPGPLNMAAITTPVKGVFDQDLGSTFYAAIADYGFNVPEAWTSVQNYVDSEGGEILGSATTPLGTSNFSSIISEAMDSGADVMLAMVYGTDMVNFMKQARDFGMTEEMTVVNPVQSISWFQLPGDPQLWEDVYFGMSWAPALKENDSTANDWANRMNDEFGYYGESFAALTYIGMKEFERAINESGGLSPSDVAGVLDGSTVPSYIMEGDIQWQACSNQAINPGYLFARGRPADQMLERGDWDFVDVVATYEEEPFLPSCSYYEEQQ